jgi:NadR type nicotinamide-nucleotide adenylyltransferase
MRKAFVLMTALPPTKGHLHLVQFASQVADIVEVDICTQSYEPRDVQRVVALKRATASLSNVEIRHYGIDFEQNPEAPGFWDMWVGLLRSWGFQEGDLIVASEDYGNKLAALLGGKYMPYDPEREILGAKATAIRDNLYLQFDQLLPEFQPFVRQTVTIFGAESTGKTTLSKELARALNGHYLMEWARPYLEHVRNEITVDTMTDIWKGQAALQRSSYWLEDKPFIFQDTDLFSTVGYWNFWMPDTLPKGLIRDAKLLKSDLYIITQSNIPFEADPLRYGGDKRESDDQYWIDLCEQYELPYVVLTSDDKVARLSAAGRNAVGIFHKNNRDLINYKRESND